jgi:hypothetical protein
MQCVGCALGSVEELIVEQRPVIQLYFGWCIFAILILLSSRNGRYSLLKDLYLIYETMAICGLPMWSFLTPPIPVSSTSHMEVCTTVVVPQFAVSLYKLIVSYTWTIMASCSSHT